MMEIPTKRDKRPTWDEFFFEICILSSKRSPCERLQVGCVLVNENRIVSQGYNGFLPGCPHESVVRNDHEQATVHAEQNAIADCAKRGVASKGCTTYITHFPCIVCARILIASGIVGIKYLNDYKNDDLVMKLCNQADVSLEKHTLTN